MALRFVFFDMETGARQGVSRIDLKDVQLAFVSNSVLLYSQHPVDSNRTAALNLAQFLRDNFPDRNAVICAHGADSTDIPVLVENMCREGLENYLSTYVRGFVDTHLLLRENRIRFGVEGPYQLRSLVEKYLGMGVSRHGQHNAAEDAHWLEQIYNRIMKGRIQESDIIPVATAIQKYKYR